GGPESHPETSPQLPVIVPNPDERYQPFELTDIQQAYWIGRSLTSDLGNVSCYVYQEFDTEILDLERLTRAWQKLIERHDMLRAVVLPEGRQQILEHVPPYRIEVLDLREEDPATAAAQLEAVRERMSHQVLPSGKWPLFEIRASLLNETRFRLHFGIDLLICDFWSLQIIIRDFLAFYEH